MSMNVRGQKVLLFRAFRLALIIMVKGVCTVLDFLVPKNNRLILISSCGGNYPYGNALAVFRHIVKEEPDYKCFFILRNRNKRLEFGDWLSFDLRGLWCFLRARYIMMTHGESDFDPFGVSPRKRVVQLWHGVPLKAMSLAEHGVVSKWHRFLLRRHNRLVDVFLVSSMLEKAYIAECFGIPAFKLVVMGRPSLDSVARDREVRNASGLRLLYAPTQRPNGDLELFPFPDYSPAVLNEFLEKNNITVHVRLHRNTRHKIISEVARIELFSCDDYPDIYTHIHMFDCLITDYSSLYIDYLILDRPMIFLPYDLSSYQRHPGLLVDDYDFWTPGPKVKTLSGFLDTLQNILNGDDVFSSHRRAVSLLLNPPSATMPMADTFRGTMDLLQCGGVGRDIGVP